MWFMSRSMKGAFLKSCSVSTILSPLDPAVRVAQLHHGRASGQTEALGPSASAPSKLRGPPRSGGRKCTIALQYYSVIRL